MAHIKEPPGVDFIIQSKPLTDEERIAISDFIRSYKAKQKTTLNSRRRTIKTITKKMST